MAELLTPEQAARFWAKVRRINDRSSCWIWTGFKNRDGYGCFNVNGKAERTHRVAYTIANKLPALPSRYEHVLHLCDHRACVSPDHLYIGTHQDNMRDKVIRHRNPTKNAAARFKSFDELTPQDITTIRHARSRGEKYAALAKRLRITIHAITQAEK